MGRYHSWVVDTEGLPATLAVTAVSPEGQIMALKHRKYDVHGIQFHPESVLTPDGKQIMKNWLDGDGKDGINGDTPLISAAKDPDNPADENYYWTIKYPKENNYTFILDGGQKIKATGPKGDKGETLSVDPIIESVVKADDGTSITINLHDGTSYNIPLLGINFKLKPGNLCLLYTSPSPRD